MTWPPQETTEFIDWLERESGAEKRALLVTHGTMSDDEAGEVWAMVLRFVWSRSVTFEEFNDRDHVEHWLRKQLRWSSIKRRQKEADYWNKNGRLKPVQLGIGAAIRTENLQDVPDKFEDERLQEAWDNLSPKRREAVECVVFGEMKFSEASAILGLNQVAVRKAWVKGLEELKQRYEGTYRSRGDGIREAWRRRKAAVA